MLSRYPGVCVSCGLKYAVGDSVVSLGNGWRKGMGHMVCPLPEEDMPYRLEGGSGFNCRGWNRGQVVSSKDHGHEDWPEYLTVVTTSRRFLQSGGFAFGVGKEAGTLYRAQCRVSTPEEIARVVRSDLVHYPVSKASKALFKLKIWMLAKGERPCGPVEPEGDIWIEKVTSFLGHSRWVVGPVYVWFVGNMVAMSTGNHFDRLYLGNNVLSFPGGGIGLRVSTTPSLVAMLECIRSCLNHSRVSAPPPVDVESKLDDIISGRWSPSEHVRTGA